MLKSAQAAARVAYVKKHAADVLKRKQKKDLNYLIKENNKSQVHYKRLLRDRKVKSRADELEDRLLGPLAPRRVVNAVEREQQGSFTQEESLPPPVLKKDKIKYWNIVPQDRVVILKGVDRHKIGTVSKLNFDNNTLIVEGMNMRNWTIPEPMRKLSPDAPTIFTREAPLHYDDVRLVYPLPDPVTGEPKDTIIAKLVTAKLFYDRHNGTHSWKRRVANSDIIIPWPKTEKKEMEEHDVDTKMLDVEFQNYHPTLLKPPFPQPVIDELRNKYSKYRTRHDPDWLAQKKAEEGAELAKKKIVRTPLQELNRKIRLEKYARGPPVLTEEMLETIGQAMAQSNPQSLERLRASRAAEVAAA